MLEPKAFANSFALTTVILYFFFFLLRQAAPPLFRLILNSQFLGADIASLVPRFSIFYFLGVLIAVGAIAWVSGYLIAHFYNRFTQERKH